MVQRWLDDPVKRKLLIVQVFQRRITSAARFVIDRPPIGQEALG
jgi:hypothetical protein